MPNDSKRKTVWTAIQHSSGLIAVLGLFLSVSAYSSQPDSSLVRAGVVMIVIGLLGFFVGRAARRSR